MQVPKVKAVEIANCVDQEEEPPHRALHCLSSGLDRAWTKYIFKFAEVNFVVCDLSALRTKLNSSISKLQTG